MAESSIHHPFALNLLLTRLRKNWKPKLDLEALLTFFQLAEEGRPEEIMRVLYKPMPSIKKDIDLLEERLKVQLFTIDPERPGHVSLTWAGEVLFGHTIHLLSLALHIERDMELRRLEREGDYPL